MAEQAYAYVTLIPVAKGFQSAVAQELSGLGGVGDGIGAKTSEGFSKGFSGGLKKLAGGAAAIFAAVGIGDFVKSAVSAGNSLYTEFEGVNQVFGSAASSVQNFAKGAAASAGLSESAALGAAKGFGVFAQAAKLGSQDSANFATSLVQAAGDLGSFNGVDTAETLEAIKSALQGQTEPLTKYGILLNDSAMRSEAMALGITNTTKNALTPQQKVLAAHSLILKNLGAAQGDFVNYADTFDNAQKTMSANFENMKANLGTQLLPVLGQVVAAINPIIVKLGPLLFEVFKSLTPVITAVTKAITSLLPALDPVVGILDVLAKVVSSLITTLLPPFMQIFNALAPIVLKIVNILGELIIKLMPSMALIIDKVLMPILDIFVEMLDKYIVPILDSLANGLSQLVPIIANGVVWAFQGLLAILKPIWVFLEPLINGLLGLAGIKIKPVIKVGDPNARYAGMTAAGQAQGYGSTMDQYLPASATAIDYSGLTGGSTGAKDAAKKAAQARADMIRSFKTDILRDLGTQMTKDTQSAKEYSTKIMDWISKAFLDGTLSKKTAQAAHALTRSYTAQLMPIIAQHEATVKSLEAAQEVLTNKIEERLDYVQSVVERFNSKLAIDEKTTAADAITQLKERIKRTKDLITAMATLTKMGLSGDLYQQIIDSGNLEFAQSVIAGGDATVKELNTLAEEANATALKLGTQAGDILFNKGINVAQGIVDGLTAKKTELENQMKDLAQAFASELALLIAGIVIPMPKAASANPLDNTLNKFTPEGEAAFKAAQDNALAQAIAAGVTPNYVGENTDIKFSRGVTTVVYNAAPNTSLESEAELQRALKISGMMMAV